MAKKKAKKAAPRGAKRVVKKAASSSAKKPAKKLAKSSPKKPVTLTVERIVARPVVRVRVAEVRLAAKSPLAPIELRPAPMFGRLLPPPNREE